MQATINIVGNVGNVRTFDNKNDGKTVYFSVAVNQRIQKDDAKDFSPVWYNFRAINSFGSALAQHLAKGRLVSVVGTAPRIREYEVERAIEVPKVGDVKFKDKKTVVEYLVVDLRFMDAPPAQQQATKANVETLKGVLVSG